VYTCQYLFSARAEEIQIGHEKAREVAKKQKAIEHQETEAAEKAAD
jgi:hypothetical protein